MPLAEVLSGVRALPRADQLALIRELEAELMAGGAPLIEPGRALHRVVAARRLRGGRRDAEGAPEVGPRA